VRRRALLGVLLSCAFVVTGIDGGAGRARRQRHRVRDNARTGWIRTSRGSRRPRSRPVILGQQFSTQLDGSIYASRWSSAYGCRDHRKGKAYGIDAKTRSDLWQRSFGKPFQFRHDRLAVISRRNLGSTSTPVYDAASNAVYVTTKIDDGPDANIRVGIAAINPTDGPRGRIPDYPAGHCGK